MSSLKKLNTTKVVVPNAFIYPHIYKVGYNDHLYYFILIFFAVAFCVMIIHYFSFLNANFRLNSVCYT